jgi:2-phosphosulfolactate phosphatase
MGIERIIEDAKRKLNQEKEALKSTGPKLALENCKGFFASSSVVFEAKVGHLPDDGKMAVLAVDVLRATATWTAIGADRPCGIQIRVKDQDGVGFMAPPPSDAVWVKAGELNGEPIPGAVMGNSPTEVWLGRFFGSWVSFESTNGARAVEKAKKVPGSEIFIVCLQNIEAVVHAAIKAGCNRFVVVAGGFYGSATLEDTVCAGRILQCLIDAGAVLMDELDDEAKIAITTAEAFIDDAKLLATLKDCQVARLLREVGREEDVDAVITGAGIDPEIWGRMKSTVLRYQEYDGLGVFIPSSQEQIA